LSEAERARLAAAVGVRHNTFAKHSEKPRPAGEASFDDQEALVLERVREVTPDFAPAD